MVLFTTAMTYELYDLNEGTGAVKGLFVKCYRNDNDSIMPELLNKVDSLRLPFNLLECTV